MTEKVISLRGDDIVQPGEASPDVVKIAEDLLERARSGDINALFAVVTHSDETVSTFHHGLVTFRVIGCVTRELHQMCAGKD